MSENKPTTTMEFTKQLETANKTITMTMLMEYDKMVFHENEIRGCGSFSDFLATTENWLRGKAEMAYVKALIHCAVRMLKLYDDGRALQFLIQAKIRCAKAEMKTGVSYYVKVAGITWSLRDMLKISIDQCKKLMEGAE